eukprot:22257-Prorocentrum_minimum.AAC.1
MLRLSQDAPSHTTGQSAAPPQPIHAPPQPLLPSFLYGAHPKTEYPCPKMHGASLHKEPSAPGQRRTTTQSGITAKPLACPIPAAI